MKHLPLGFIILIILVSNSNCFFSSLTNYVSGLVGGMTKEMVHKSKGYKDTLSSIYEIVRTVNSKDSKNSFFIDALNNLLRIIISNYSKYEEKAEEEKKIGFFENFKLKLFSRPESHSEEFVNGIFEGLSGLHLNDNLCYQEILKGNGDTLKIIQSNFKKIFDTVEKDENLVQEIIDLYESIKKLKTDNLFSSECQVDSLLKEIVSISNTFGAAKLAYRIFTNRDDLYETIVDIYQHFDSDKSRHAGQSMGKLLKILFNYSIK